MQRKKILLIDDSETILLLERQILGPYYDLVTAKDGRAGISAALSERPDLIVLDLVMPKANGLEVCERLRAEEATRRTPIVVVTTLTEARMLTAIDRLGWSSFVPKPLNTAALLAAVRRFLDARPERRGN